MKKVLYPLTFQSIFKDKIWGGEAISAYKGITTDLENIGESWEISPVPGDVSIVANGILEGSSLQDLAKEYGAELLGQHVYDQYGADFPLLIKLIDANDTLSVQVHPDDKYAAEHHNSRGKTEMWYLLDTRKGAKIYANWHKQTNSEQLREIVKTGEVMDYMGAYDAKPGDLFFLPAGTVHAIGAGCFVLEIQQASDVTYRLYDFNRKDDQGHYRDLHVDDAVKVIDYDTSFRSQIKYQRDLTNRLTSVVRCPYFETSYLPMEGTFEHHLLDRDSFTYLFLIDGSVTLHTEHGEMDLTPGTSILLPASIKTCRLVSDGEAHLIDCFVPRS